MGVVLLHALVSFLICDEHFLKIQRSTGLGLLAFLVCASLNLSSYDDPAAAVPFCSRIHQIELQQPQNEQMIHSEIDATQKENNVNVIISKAPLQPRDVQN